MTARVLCVDDEERVLDACRRNLGLHFDLDLALSGEQALGYVEAHGPYAVVVSDMRMPEMDGVQLLRRVGELAPLTVRIMLTGDGDQRTAMEAINRGRIFRFLTKPCPPDEFKAAIEAGIEQHRLLTAERELLEQTLSGSVRLLTEVLSVVSPLAFGRAERVRKLARQVADLLEFQPLWPLDLAAMLSQLGCIAVPQAILAKACSGARLNLDEQMVLLDHPALGAQLLSHIPRLDEVARLVALQAKGFDGSGPPVDGPVGEEIPLGARILKAVLDYDLRQSAGERADAVVMDMAKRVAYDPRVTAQLAVVAAAQGGWELSELPVKDLRTGMVLARDVVTPAGVLLVGRGQEINDTVWHRLAGFARLGQVPEPVKVLVQRG